MRRFITMHESEAGFATPDEAATYIATQAEPHRWRVIEIIPDAVTEWVANREQVIAIDRAYVHGKESERERIKALLGLD